MTYNDLKKQMIHNFESDINVSISELVDSIKEEYGNYSAPDKFFDKNIFIDTSDASEDMCNYSAIIEFHKTATIPPMNSIVVKPVLNHDDDKKIFFSYEYRYRYTLQLTLQIDVLMPKILKILRSVFWINKCRNEYAEIIKKRFAKLRFSNELQYWNNLFLISEGANEQYTKELEDWLDSQLSTEQKIAQSNAYELFWDGIPSDRRYFIKTNL